MTTQNQLKASPLTIEHHAFSSIQIDAAEAENPNDPHSLRTRRRIEQSPENPLRWMVILTVEFNAAKEGSTPPYTGKVTVQGWFSIAEGYPEEKQAALIEVTAASILYGACREMIAGFTARSYHGIMSLPSVSFAPIQRQETQTPTAAKKRTKKPVSTKKKTLL
jgi:preprotein translocase subunit SecB